MDAEESWSSTGSLQISVSLRFPTSHLSLPEGFFLFSEAFLVCVRAEAAACPLMGESFFPVWMEDIPSAEYGLGMAGTARSTDRYALPLGQGWHSLDGMMLAKSGEVPLLWVALH